MEEDNLGKMPVKSLPSRWNKFKFPEHKIVEHVHVTERKRQAWLGLWEAGAE